MNIFLKKIGALLMALHLLALCLPAPAAAALFSTGEAVAESVRQERIERIDGMLAREDVRRQLIGVGVNPDEARLRVAALSDMEMQQLEAGINALPAGGDGALWVLGVVFLVLLVLEIVGVIDIFNKV